MKRAIVVASMSLVFLAANVARSADAPAKPVEPKPAKVAAPKPAAVEPTYSGLNPKTMAPNAGTPDNTAPAGFVAAFNGKDLTGFKGLQKGPNDNPIKRAAQKPD